MKRLSTILSVFILISLLTACGKDQAPTAYERPTLTESIEYSNSARPIANDDELKAKLVNRDKSVQISINDFNGFTRVSGSDIKIQYISDDNAATVNFQLFEGYTEDGVLETFYSFASNGEYNNVIDSASGEYYPADSKEYKVFHLVYVKDDLKHYQTIYVKSVDKNNVLCVTYEKTNQEITSEESRFLIDNDIISVTTAESASEDSSSADAL